MHVALQVFAYKEPGLGDTLDAWAAQNVPDSISVRYESWVTPSGEKQSCGTWQQARDHPVFEAREAPQYKLPSRNAAHTDAVRSGVDAVVAADADAPPMNRNVLSGLTRRLRRPGVAAVVSRPKPPVTPLGLYSRVKLSVREKLCQSVHGQCHAFTVDAWRVAGPFSESIDHTELQSVWLEEEYRFAHRLRGAGEIDYARDIRVYDDTRRLECKYHRATGRGDGSFCNREAGTETFNPR